ncbi:MAG: hypothetical protein JNM22_22845 [Saprospiraceae bacterium]|nr:hypothetical protein [Saprospiraceae bacterium]
MGVRKKALQLKQPEAKVWVTQRVERATEWEKVRKGVFSRQKRGNSLFGGGNSGLGGGMCGLGGRDGKAFFLKVAGFSKKHQKHYLYHKKLHTQST